MANSSEVENVSVQTIEDDEDTHRSDLEVASVFSKGIRSTNAQASPSKHLLGTPAKYNYSPFRPSTAMTNVSRGNVQTATPCVIPKLTIHQMAAQGELLLLQAEINDHDINELDEHGLTMIMWASAYNQIAVLTYLVEQGADCLATGFKGENALLIATAEGHVQVVETLLDLNMEMNYCCQNGNSALCYAVYNGHVDCVRVLLEWGADITVRNKEGYCPMDIAILRNSKEVQVALEKHMMSLLEST